MSIVVEPKELNDGQRSALVAVCDTLIPAIDRVDDGDGFWARSASDMAIAQITEQLILTAMPDKVRLKKGPPLWLMWRDEQDDSVDE